VVAPAERCAEPPDAERDAGRGTVPGGGTGMENCVGGRKGALGWTNGTGDGAGGSTGGAG
jgi:hypothetical protein